MCLMFLVMCRHYYIEVFIASFTRIQHASYGERTYVGHVFVSCDADQRANLLLRSLSHLGFKPDEMIRLREEL